MTWIPNRPARQPSATVRLYNHGPLHAAQEARDVIAVEDVKVPIPWVRPLCAKVWRAPQDVWVYDYRYRHGPLCRHPACRKGFSWLDREGV